MSEKIESLPLRVMSSAHTWRVDSCRSAWRVYDEEQILLWRFSLLFRLRALPYHAANQRRVKSFRH